MEEAREPEALLPPSPARFAGWLSPTGEVREDGSDPECVRQAARFVLDRWHVVPVLAPRLLDWAQVEVPELHRVELRCIFIRYLWRLQERAVARLAAGLGARRIPYVLLKGSVVRYTAYAPETRISGDLDIAVPRRHLDAARRLTLDLGYVESQWDDRRRAFVPASPALRAAVEARHYELGYLVRNHSVRGLPPADEAAIREQIGDFERSAWHVTTDGRLAAYTLVDVHHGLTHEIPADEIVASGRPHTVGTTTVCLPAAGWAFFHTVFKLYWEGVHGYGVGGYQYADVVRMLDGLTDDDQRLVIDLACRYRLEAGVYYVLRRLPSHFGRQLPERLATFVREQHRPPAGTQAHRANDLGDLWPKIWGHR